jgi:unsaturated rhamnogalacturonyl hydrolase
MNDDWNSRCSPLNNAMCLPGVTRLFASIAIRLPRWALITTVMYGFVALTPSRAEGPPRQTLSIRMANAIMQRWPSGGQSSSPEESRRWGYELGILLEGMDSAWYNTADGDYFRYIKGSVDALVGRDGAIATYDLTTYSLDNILAGRQLLLLYRVTGGKRYFDAARRLRYQLESQPKNASGGFWHAQMFPNQMWIDGIYMAEPFFAEYASVFHEPQDFAEIAHQFALIEQHAGDPRTGLLYHGWDESKQQKWANPVSGTSANLWGRGIGWYMMALVDTLPYFPEDDPGRAQLLDILKRTAAAIVRYQDPGSGLWYQVLDKGSQKGNYFESSAACMFTYALAKGVRMGYLPREYESNAQRAWRGIQSRFLQFDSKGEPNLTGTVQEMSLDMSKHHDGSYSYYVSSPVGSNDPKGVGAFLLAATEMEHASDISTGLGSTVMLDAWYNSQTRSNAAGQMDLFHYKWDDFSNSGYSLFGHIFEMHGLQTRTLRSAPTLDKLKDARLYVIVSPDNPSKTPSPHYMNAQDARQIAGWVRQGGVLVLMENDRDNADIPHLDVLADIFGLHFNNVLTHHVIGDQIEMGRIDVPHPSIPFATPHVLYMKDTCSLSLSRGAIPLLQWKGDTMMAMAHYGKGTVVAVTDPWLYNEYTDGRNLPSEYDNFAAGEDFVAWLLHQP